MSEHEKRDLKHEIMAGSKKHFADAEHADHDLGAIGFIGGIPVVSHRHVPRGQARVMLKTDVADRNRDLVVR